MDYNEAKQIASDFLLDMESNNISAYLTGSLRRQCNTVKDINILVIKSKRAFEIFRVNEKTQQVKINRGKIEINVRFINEAELGAALLHYTGCPKFIIGIRYIAKQNGFKLNQHGLFTKDGQLVCSESEIGILAQLNMMMYSDPTKRNNIITMNYRTRANGFIKHSK